MGSTVDRVGCLSSSLCIYSAPNCSKALVCSAVYGTVYYIEPLKAFYKSM